jgi:hypothetical protein
MISSARRAGSKQPHPKETNPGNIAMNEIDNHANMIFLNCLVNIAASPFFS